MTPLLEIKNLSVDFSTASTTTSAIRNISLRVNRRETVAIVGESGSGKTVTSLSILQLLPSPSAIYKNGKILFSDDGVSAVDLLKLNNDDLRKVRGNKIAMIFQEPMTSLNPVKTCGEQVMEAMRIHQPFSKKEARIKTIELFKQVKLPDPSSMLDRYPHEISGGQKQRVMIAMAVSCHPALLIADEPTTALDVTIQAQILKLMSNLNEETGASIILITHDLGVVAKMADKIIVMYAGKPVEIGNKYDIFYNPKHPYTWGLLRALPKINTKTKEELKSIHGTPPNMVSPPKGCAFAARCEYAMEVCLEHDPELLVQEEGHEAACWLNHPHAKEQLDQIKSDQLADMEGGYHAKK